MVEHNVANVARSEVTLDHEGLVAAIRIYISCDARLCQKLPLKGGSIAPVEHVFDRGAVGQATYGTSSRLVAPYCNVFGFRLMLNYSVNSQRST